MLTVAIGKDLFYSNKYEVRFGNDIGGITCNLEGDYTAPYPGGQIPDEAVDDLIHFLVEYKNRVNTPLTDACDKDTPIVGAYL